MDFGIKKAINTGNGNAIIYVAIGSAMLANCLPTPADAVYFWRQSVDKNLLNDNKITPKQYWVRQTVGYYTYTAAWYGLVLTTVAAVGSDYKTKAKILLGLVGAGLVMGVVSKNIKEDEKRMNYAGIKKLNLTGYQLAA